MGQGKLSGVSDDDEDDSQIFYTDTKEINNGLGGEKGK